MNNALILSLILRYAGAYHVSPELAISIVQYESSFKVSAVGKAGEVGLFQLLPSTFPAYTKAELFDPETNIKLGIQYLAEAKENCPHREDYTYLLCFNMGNVRAKKVKYPKKFPYYKNVMRIYHENLYSVSN